MAATEPVTPSSTLAMASLAMLRFDRVEQPGREFCPGDPLITLCRAEVGPLGRAVERVGDHPVGIRLPARLFGDSEKLLIADANLQLELHEDAAKCPVPADPV